MEEITWIRTLIPLSYKFRCTDHPTELQPTAISEMLHIQIFQLRHLQTFTQFFISIIYKSFVLKFHQKSELNKTGIYSNEKCF